MREKYSQELTERRKNRAEIIRKIRHGWKLLNYEGKKQLVDDLNAAFLEQVSDDEPISVDEQMEIERELGDRIYPDERSTYVQKEFLTIMRLFKSKSTLERILQKLTKLISQDKYQL